MSFTSHSSNTSKVYPLLPTTTTTRSEKKDDPFVNYSSNSLDTPHLRVLLLQLVMTIIATILYSFTDETFISCVIVVSVSVSSKLCLSVFFPRHPDRHVLFLSSLLFSTLYVISLSLSLSLSFPELTPIFSGSTSSCWERSRKSTLASYRPSRVRRVPSCSFLFCFTTNHLKDHTRRETKIQSIESVPHFT